MFSFTNSRTRRRPSLTPMIDVVFLVLVFFKLASQFGYHSSLRLSAAGGSGAYTGPPRLIEIGAGDVRLNGSSVSIEALPDILRPMTENDDDIVILRGEDDTPLQRLIDVTETLQTAGFTRLSVVE